MEVFHGIQVYEILDNGNLLNAIYTDTALLKKGVYAIDNEITRKIKYDDRGVEGLYDCRYIETGKASVKSCELEIKNTNGVYNFIWKQDNKKLFTGMGLMAGTAHIAVSYVQV